MDYFKSDDSMLLDPPRNRMELAAAKYKLLKAYRDKDDPMNDNMLLEMMVANMHMPAEADNKRLTVDGLFGAQKNSPNSSRAGGIFDFSELDNFEALLGQVPLGGYVKTATARGGTPTYKSIATKDVLDSSSAGGGLLVPIGIVPQLFVWLATQFKAWDRIMHVPANGVNHSWRNLIDLGDANDGFIDEFGCPTPAQGTYFAGSTNIAILAIERGVSLKLQFAYQQSGFSFAGYPTPVDIEMKNAMISRARILEKCFFQGTTASGHTGADEYGTTFANGFNGLRALISNSTLANTVHGGTYPTGFNPIVIEPAANPVSGTPLTDAIDQGIAEIVNNGGTPTAVYMSVDAALQIKQENSKNIRIALGDIVSGATGEIIGTGQTYPGFTVGGRVEGIDSVAAGFVPFIIVPRRSIGSYPVNSIAANGGTTTLTAGHTAQDIYILSEGDLAFPYLGSQDPLPIEVPAGVPGPDGTGCLTRRLIVYLMTGFAMYIPVHQAKVRFQLV